MPKVSKQELKRLRVRAGVDRTQYIAAVQRHDARVDAICWDFRGFQEVSMLLRELNGDTGDRRGEEANWSDAVPKAFFDDPADISRDDRLIGLYLADNPGERRLPHSRGETIEELGANWEGTDHCIRSRERQRQFIEKMAKDVAQEYLDDESNEG